MKPAIAILLLMLCRLHAGEFNATSLSAPGSFTCENVKVQALENAAGALELKVTIVRDEHLTTQYSIPLDRKRGEPFLIYWDKDARCVWSATPTNLFMEKYSLGRSEGSLHNLSCGLKALNPPAEFVEKVRALKIAGPDQD